MEAAPRKPLSGAETIAFVRERTDTILLAFSCGKDAIAAWLECRKHFRRIEAFHLYLVPDLEFVESSLRYYEGFFGTRIHRLPHPSLYRMLRNNVFQPPANVSVIQAAQLPPFDYWEQEELLRQEMELSGAAYTATGVRSADSMTRALAIKHKGAISHEKRKFYPIWDWRKDRLIAEIRGAGCRLPIDYRIFGRSLDGIDYQYLAPIKRHFPRDYERILNVFPLAEVELMRMQYAQRH